MNEQESKIEQEHKGFLRKIANEVYELVRNTANMVRFREQVKIFCEKNEEHQREIELLEKASLADSKLQEAIKKNEKKMWGKTWEEMTEGEKGSIDPDPPGFHVAKPEGFENYVFHTHLKDSGNKYNSYHQFWGLPAKTSGLLEFLTPPPEREGGFYPDFWDFEFSKQPDDNEKLVCCYALLAIIHDIQILEKPIFTAKIYNGTWNLRNKWKGILWEGCTGKRWDAIPSHRIEGLSDTRAWITRALNDVKDDLAEKPAEAEQKTTPAKLERESLWLVLYEKTLKVIVDAVLGILWHK
jgi:hypothetical protein